MYSSNNISKVNFSKKISKLRRICRRKPILLTIIILVYLFCPNFIWTMVFETSEEANFTVSNDSYQVTVPVRIIPDVAPDFKLTELRFSVVRNSIFFIKLSETGNLNSRQACSIESAAKNNPDRNISVIFIEPIPKILKFVNLAILLTHEYKNIVFYRAPVSMFVKNTPLEDKDEDTWPTLKENTLKYLSFYIFGGTYLELDMIVTRSFASLPWNWVVKENNESLAIGAMSVTHLESGHLFAVTAATELWENFCTKNWKRKVVRVITRAMKKFCTSQDVSNMSAATCHGIEVLEPHTFYPITFWPHIFHPGNISVQPYAYHFWDDLSKIAYVDRKTVFDKLATRFCPNVYHYFLRMIF